MQLEHTVPVAEDVSLAADHICLSLGPDTMESVLYVSQQDVQKDERCDEYCQCEPGVDEHCHQWVVYDTSQSVFVNVFWLANHGDHFIKHGAEPSDQRQVSVYRIFAVVDDHGWEDLYSIGEESQGDEDGHHEGQYVNEDLL